MGTLMFAGYGGVVKETLEIGVTSAIRRGPSYGQKGLCGPMVATDTAVSWYW